ncbi:MAG: pyruvate carboxylase [Actinobacteria bacterium]|nr:pyruvate carboxylase [Actinomycetota bacterium]
MFDTVLVANRGEIAIRAFRAATELGLRTVGVYTHEDRDSLHRLKADEAYRIGEPGHPVRAYLDGEQIIAVARRVGAGAVYPGYGFLSENPGFAARCEAAGVTFVGPPAEVLRRAGDKTEARDIAAAAGLDVLDASGVVSDLAAATHAAERLGFPVFVKAAAGGGGRGLRRVASANDLPGAVDTAIREARGAFGDERIFLEQAVTRPRHIEAQILADAAGRTVHLWERDCSVQRRHQKVLEIAPAPNLDPDLRARICAAAVRFAEAVGYRNAGTVEFLLAPDGRFVFIEMNPRIQVEHTVTEEITDVDLVQAQLQIAAGASLDDLGLAQEAITTRGVAIQCRITTEDPANGFRPDTGRITAYRSASGAGIRLDAGSAYVGSSVSPYFDSLLVKLTARGHDLHAAARRARRALAEFRIRGVSTNTAFLRALLDDPDLLAGDLSTGFIDDHPDLVAVDAGRDRGTRLLEFLADVTVNRPYGAAPAAIDPAGKLPDRSEAPVPSGGRDRLRQLGPEGFARWLRTVDAVGVTDTTFRDAHQSLLATRMRTYDMLAAAPAIAAGMSELLSIEMWGGATFDVALRFLHEDPWDRLTALRAAVPNICMQMLLRGRNAVGYSAYPPQVVRAFVAEAAAGGVDIFRIFDALNNVDAMRAAIEATLEAGAVAEGAICYTGDLHDPGARVYTLDYYLGVAEQLVEAGVHVLCIKDMAGLLRPPAARTLVAALRERFAAPVHLHTHDTGGGQLATYLAAIAAGVDAVDGAAAPLSGMTSQPNLAAVVAATDHTPRATGLQLEVLTALEPYWEAVRDQYAPFEAGLRSPTGAVYRHEIPGGQLSNLRQQAIALGLGERFEELAELYRRCNELLGDLIKVTPTSKVVGDLALYLASAGIAPEQLVADPARFDLPDSVIGYLHGELGEPPGGWPEPLRSRVLAARGDRPEPPALTDAQRRDLRDLRGRERRDLLNDLLFPGPTAARSQMRERYGDLGVVPTWAFLGGLVPHRELQVDLSPGVRLFIELEAVGDPDEQGIRTVVCALNGQSRPVDARDRSIEADPDPVERADPDDPAHVAAALTGVVTITVAAGDTVAGGAKLGSIEAMKMESNISAPHAGTVTRVVTSSGTAVEPGDLLLVLDPS